MFKYHFPSYDSSIIEYQGGTMYKYKPAHKGEMYRHNFNFNIEVPQTPESHLAAFRQMLQGKIAFFSTDELDFHNLHWE